MERKDLIALINAKIAGQGNQIDLGGALASVLVELAGAAAPIEVADIAALTGEQLDALNAGDKVVKKDVSGAHVYVCTYKGAGGLSLSYFDCDNVETIAYVKNESEWAYDDKTVTPISTIRG